MPDIAAISRQANIVSNHNETPTVNGGRNIPPPSFSHGSGTVDRATTPVSLPPSLTPATTTRPAVALAALWGSGISPYATPHSDTLITATIPAIITHAASPEAQEPPSDLIASTSSLPSTTTTLTNTLPPRQSAALRALNAPAFQSHASSTTNSKPAKSTSSRTTLSSQPVVVRTYSGPRHPSRPSSGRNSPRFFPGMNGHGSQNPSALSAGLAGRDERLPALEEFSFSAILRAVDPEIRDAIDAIAEICARSRLSLADEYDAHLPPQGEITGTGPGWSVGMGSLVGRGRISRLGQGWPTTENTLTAVPEASSSSERLAGDSRESVTGDGPKKRNRSAYGSLKSMMSGGSGKKTAEVVEPSSSPEESKGQPAGNPRSTTWAVKASSSSSTHPFITLITSPQASKQLSLDLSSTITDVPEDPNTHSEPSTEIKDARRGHRRNISSISMITSRTRSSTLSSLTSWIPWNRPSDMDPSTSEELTKAEARLREMLTASQSSSSAGKGKTPATSAAT